MNNTTALCNGYLRVRSRRTCSSGWWISPSVIQAPSHQCEIEAIIALQTETVVVLRHGEIFLDKL